MLYNINHPLKNSKSTLKAIFMKKKKLAILHLFKEFITDKYKEVNCNVRKPYIMHFIHTELQNVTKSIATIYTFNSIWLFLFVTDYMSFYKTRPYFN